MVVTLPLGQNPNLDRHFKERRAPFSRRALMRRTSMDRWVEAGRMDCNGAKHGETRTRSERESLVVHREGMRADRMKSMTVHDQLPWASADSLSTNGGLG